jgi:hypothetical protein
VTNIFNVNRKGRQLISIDIAEQHQEQQEAKQLPGKISSYCLLMGIIFTEESLQYRLILSEERS